MKILVLNAGSSSQKSSLYELTNVDAKPLCLWEAQLDWSHQENATMLRVKTSQGIEIKTSFSSHSRSDDTIAMLETLWQGTTQVIKDFNEIDVVGHRVVHGGQIYQQATLITPEVKTEIEHLSAFAPIHNPINLEGIAIIAKILGEVPQVAVFDTAFHSTLSAAAYVYPLPTVLVEHGIRRYGFHGISHQYCTRRLAEILGSDLQGKKLINCHLGNGCSLAAIKDGKSIDTTMGFTPLEGLMMGTRSGSIDPGILIHLLREGSYTVDQLDQLLNRKSGLLGVSGISGDLRQVTEAIAQGHELAQLALDIYVHRLRAGIGAMVASLQGLDILVFTAGVGENSALIRELTCQAFAFLGLTLDLAKNSQVSADYSGDHDLDFGDQDISAPDSKVRVLVIHTQEDQEIARECWNLMASGRL